MSQYQKGKTNLDFTEAKDSEWQWHQLGHMQVCTSLQTDNHASTPPLGFLQAGCPSCHPTNSVKALKEIGATESHHKKILILIHIGLVRIDGKQPDGLTLIPSQGGKPLTRDVTVVSTLADSYLHSTSHCAGSTAETASDRKETKYSFLPPDFIF